MNGISLASEGPLIVAALACLALILLVLAGWLGRWPLWVAGWFVAILALAAVFLFRAPADGDGMDAEREGTLIGMHDVYERALDPRVLP